MEKKIIVIKKTLVQCRSCPFTKYGKRYPLFIFPFFHPTISTIKLQWVDLIQDLPCSYIFIKIYDLI